MFLYTSYNCFEATWYSSFQYVCKHLISLFQMFYSPNKFFYLFSFSGLYSMVKAFITGSYICHTTNILNCKFRTIHWTKPPSFSYFQKICFFQAFLLKNPNSHFRFFFISLFISFLVRYKTDFKSFSYLRMLNFIFRNSFFGNLLFSESLLFC